jgi:hypothetical protein
MLELSEQANAKNLKVGVGLMSRHARHLQELHKRVQDGEIGDVMLMRGYRMPRSGGLGLLEALAARKRNPANCSGRSSASTASSGRAAVATATSTSTTSITCAG